MFMNSTSTGHTEGQSQRSLQTSDELRTMKKGTILFVNASSQAAILRTIAYFEDRKLAKLADLPFELDLPKPPPIIMVDPQEDQEETTPEVTTMVVMEPWSSLVRIRGGETGEEQEPREWGLEEEVTTYTIAPEE